MITIFLGAESADHRHTLESVREMFDPAPRVVVGVNFKALRSRRQTARYVEKTIDIFPTVLMSGYEHAPLSEEVDKARDEYYAMVAEVPTLIHATQFHAEDSLLPKEERLIPWSDGSDLDRVKGLLDVHGCIALEYRDGDDSRIPGLLRSQDSSRFAVSLAHSDLSKAKQAGFSAVATSMWLNPGRYGEVQFWDGSAFHRSKDKEAFLRRFLPNIEAVGFDVDLVSRHDSREMVRLAAWSLMSWADHLASSSWDMVPPESEVSDTSDENDSPESETRHLASVLSFPKTETHPSRKTGSQVARQGPPDVVERATTPLPVFSSIQETVFDSDPDGEPSVGSRPLLQTMGGTVRTCDSCHLSGVCPAFKPQNSCAFNFPVEVRTDVQVRALLASLVEMQTARVAFARFGEELKGGYPDPVVGMEMDRLMRLTDKVMKPNERRERLTLSVESESSGPLPAGGVLSRIFGPQNAPPSTPQPPDYAIGHVIEGDDVTDS